MFSRLYVDLFLFSFFFSISFCVFCSLVDNLLGFWFFLELCGLSLVPSFFYTGSGGVYNFYGSLLTYLVVSSLSSVFLLSGILFSNLYMMVVIGFIIKLGLFPFMFWVYRVFSGSNWAFIFLVSVVAKFPILFFCFLLENGGQCQLVLFIDAFMTILVCSCMFWFYSHSWECIWCHISQSSVSTLFVACFCSDFSTCFFIYCYYFIWAGSSLFYLYCEGSDSLGLRGRFWWYCFLLLVTPLSLPLFYKLSVCLAILYSSIYLLLVWCLYSFSEQFFLYKVATDNCFSGVFNSWC
uniref:NADH dehydrogenase subunit 2 n=1 Tax=Duthiersia expansa TaxID=2015383 RepID=A0A8F7CBY2_9CEST|nr:NADH dehydrogenase subunit 2 [Duthiersia expansa]